MNIIDNIFEKQSFADFLQANSLESPPLPVGMLDIIEEHYPNVYSTDARLLPFSFSSLDLANADMIFNAEDAFPYSEKISYFATGIAGYGMQSWFFIYLLATENAELAISLPYGNAYGDVLEDKVEIEAMYLFIEASLAYLKEGQKLKFAYDMNHCEWSLTDTETDTTTEGSEIAALLDLLECNGGARIGVENMQWIRI